MTIGFEKNGLPDKPQPVRVAFCKKGALQYISHLDLQRTFGRAVIRAGVPIWYTEGFNPKPRLAFSTPLSVGCESDYELLDFRIVRNVDFDRLKDALNGALPAELAVSDVYVPQRKFTDIAYAVYKIGIAEHEAEQKAGPVRELLSRPEIVVYKRSKSGDKDTNIAPMIKNFQVTAEERKVQLTVTLSASSAEYLNPEYLVTYLREAGVILQGALPTREYTLLRCDLLDGKLAHFR